MPSEVGRSRSQLPAGVMCIMCLQLPDAHSPSASRCFCLHIPLPETQGILKLMSAIGRTQKLRPTAMSCCMVRSLAYELPHRTRPTSAHVCLISCCCTPTGTAGALLAAVLYFHSDFKHSNNGGVLKLMPVPATARTQMPRPKAMSLNPGQCLLASANPGDEASSPTCTPGLVS